MRRRRPTAGHRHGAIPDSLEIAHPVIGAGASPCVVTFVATLMIGLYGGGATVIAGGELVAN